MDKKKREQLIAADSDFKWNQIGFRDGDMGDVHDTYELKFRNETILVVRHYVQLSLDETPLVITVPNANHVDITKL